MAHNIELWILVGIDFMIIKGKNSGTLHSGYNTGIWKCGLWPGGKAYQKGRLGFECLNHLYHLLPAEGIVINGDPKSVIEITLSAPTSLGLYLNLIILLPTCSTLFFV